MTKAISDSFSYVTLPSLHGNLWPKGSNSPICFDRHHTLGNLSTVFISGEEYGGEGNVVQGLEARCVWRLYCCV